MKILLMLIAIGASLSYNQEKQVKAKVYYEFEHIDDISQPDNPYLEDIVVYLSPEASLQKSMVALELRKAVDDFVYNRNRQVNASGTAVFNTPTVNKDISPYEYYHNIEERQSFLFSHIFDTFYVIEQQFPAIDWELLEEQKEIGGYACQRAKGDFRGRTYYAWFTLELPFPFGPWKLQGLPGLILEAEDKKKEVFWTYLGFEKAEDKYKEVIASPYDAIKASKERFDRLFEATKKNPEGARKAATEAAKSTGRMGIQIHNSLITEFMVGKLRKQGFKEKAVNNPVELVNW